MEFHILASGSKGNSTFIYDNGVGILIDCGIARKQLLYKLGNLGFQESNINYVLLTHDHYDHNKNISIFDQRICFCGKGCIKGIDSSHEIKPYKSFQLAHFEIMPLSISHDATSPLAFIITGVNESILKQRIHGDLGHLNNEYSAKMMVELIGDKTKEIVLAHLSGEANTKEKALETYRKIFNQNNLEFDNIKVASQIDVVSGGNYED